MRIFPCPVIDLQGDGSARLYIGDGFQLVMQTKFYISNHLFLTCFRTIEGSYFNFFALLKNKVKADSRCDTTITQIQGSTSISPEMTVTHTFFGYLFYEY